MESLVVITADPGEDLAAGLVAGREPALVDEFSFQGGEERLGDVLSQQLPTRPTDWRIL